MAENADKPQNRPTNKKNSNFGFVVSKSLIQHLLLRHVSSVNPDLSSVNPDFSNHVHKASRISKPEKSEKFVNIVTKNLKTVQEEEEIAKTKNKNKP